MTISQYLNQLFETTEGENMIICAFVTKNSVTKRFRYA